MILRAATAPFRHALGLVAAVVPAKSPIPALSCLKLRVTASGAVILGATDSDSSLVCQVADARGDEPLSLVIPASDLSAILREIVADSFTLATDDDRHYTIRAGRATFRRNLEDPAAYPGFYGLGLAPRLTGEAECFRRAIARVESVAKGADEFRGVPALLLDARRVGPEGIASVVAFDGQKCVAESFPVGYPDSSPSGAAPLVPIAHFRHIKPLLLLGGHCAIGWDDRSVRIAAGPAIFAGRLLAARFPDWRQYARDSSPRPIRFAADAFLRMIDAGSLNVGESGRIDVTFAAGLVSLTSVNERGSSASALEIAYAGPEMTVGFPARSLASILEPLRDAEVTLHLKDGHSLAWFVSEAWEAVVAPIVA
jgi:DNA polymerase III subunit beta